jgi:hypothetical protein
MVRRWHADPFGFLRPWNELPAVMGSAPPSTRPSTGSGVVTFPMGWLPWTARIRAAGLLTWGAPWLAGLVQLISLASPKHGNHFS